MDLSDYITSLIIQISSTNQRCVFVLKNGYVFMCHVDEITRSNNNKSDRFKSMRIFGIRRINCGCLMDDKLKVTGGRNYY